MKSKYLFTMLLAGAAMTASAQGYKDGVEYYKADRIDNAKELLLRNINNAETDKAEAYYYLGCIAIQEGNNSEAAKYFNDGIAIDPENAYNYIGLGQIDLLNKLPKAAEKNFKSAEKKAKKDAEVYVEIARAYYNADPVAYQKEIDKKIEKARRTNLSDASIFVFEGDMFADKQSWGESTGSYEMATTYEPNAAEAYVKGADTYFKINPKYAISLLQKLLQENPNSALGQRELAEAYYKNNMFTKAAEEYGKYISNPNHFKHDEERYLVLLFYGKDYKYGYDYASKLLAEDANNFTARRFQMIFATFIPEYKEQLLGLAEGVMAHKSAENLLAVGDYKMIANIMVQNDRTDEAVKTIETGVADYPKETSLLETLADMQAENGQLEDAAATLEKYVATFDDPSGSDLWALSGYLYAAGRSQTDMAKRAEYFEKSIKYGGMAKDKLADDYKYRIPKRMGDIAKLQATTEDEQATAAIENYKEALQLMETTDAINLFPNDATELYTYLGMAHIKIKDYPAAINYLEKILEKDPNNEALKKTIEQLRKTK